VIDDSIFSALKPIVLNDDGQTARVFPDVAPEGTPTPWITYQSAGGQDANDLDGPADRMNTRMQIGVWASTRREATLTMNLVIAAICGDPLDGVPIGAPVSIYEQPTKLYGSRLDFSIWYLP
jgi:hypothetical protein